MERADVIIVGAGSAGAALAARLSEEPALRVLLIEAGKDTPPGAVPHDIAEIFPSAFLNSGYFWPQTTASMMEGDAPGRFPQARVMGGGPSVMSSYYAGEREALGRLIVDRQPDAILGAALHDNSWVTGRAVIVFAGIGLLCTIVIVGTFSLRLARTWWR